MHTLKISTVGTFCNEYPKCSISINDTLFYNGYIDKKVFEIPLDNTLNRITIRHYDKHFGLNHRWDTKSQNDKIIADRTISILDMSIDDISFKSAFDKFEFVQEPQNKEPIINKKTWDGYFNFNGYVTFNIDSNPLSWVTNVLYKRPIENLSYFSNHSTLFHYEEELLLIKEIEECLKEQQ